MMKEVGRETETHQQSIRVLFRVLTNKQIGKYIRKVKFQLRIIEERSSNKICSRQSRAEGNNAE